MLLLGWTLTSPAHAQASSPDVVRGTLGSETGEHSATRGVDVEPASARARLREDAWVFSRPSRWSKHLKRVHAPKYVIVTGSTRYYLRIRLKNGDVGYLRPTAVKLVRPTDKIFTLTADAVVRENPNRWGKKLAEVHRGRYVHAIGFALNYVRIRMKSGLKGFIPMSALQ